MDSRIIVTFRNIVSIVNIYNSSIGRACCESLNRHVVPKRFVFNDSKYRSHIFVLWTLGNLADFAAKKRFERAFEEKTDHDDIALFRS